MEDDLDKVLPNGHAGNPLDLDYLDEKQERAAQKQEPRSTGREEYPGKRRLTREKYLPWDKPTEELRKTRIHEGALFAQQNSQGENSKIGIFGSDPNQQPPELYESFEECGFAQEIVANMEKMGMHKPTLIQKGVLPILMQRRDDLLGLAETGSGKTAAFMLPIIDKIHGHKARRKLPRKLPGGMPYAIVVAPTKELVAQLYNEARMIAEGTLVTVVRSYGDIPMMPQVREIKEGCDVAVMTVGRLEHFVREEIIRLHQLRYLVLDEVDKLLEGEFLEKIYAVKRCMDKRHRTLAFSATMFRQDKEKLELGFFGPHYYFLRVGMPNTMAETVEHRIIRVERYEKQGLLIDMLMRRAEEKTRGNGGPLALRH